jgi:hypothetical protein
MTASLPASAAHDDVQDDPRLRHLVDTYGGAAVIHAVGPGATARFLARLREQGYAQTDQGQHAADSCTDGMCAHLVRCHACDDQGAWAIITATPGGWQIAAAHALHDVCHQGSQEAIDPAIIRHLIANRPEGRSGMVPRTTRLDGQNLAVQLCSYAGPDAISQIMRGIHDVGDQQRLNHLVRLSAWVDPLTVGNDLDLEAQTESVATYSTCLLYTSDAADDM